MTKCVVPYLYGHAYFEKHGVMPFSELRHGGSGIVQDLESLYGTSSAAAIGGFVRLTALSKRVANKASCPCGSGRRLADFTDALGKVSVALDSLTAGEIQRSMTPCMQA